MPSRRWLKKQRSQHQNKLLISKGIKAKRAYDEFTLCTYTVIIRIIIYKDIYYYIVMYNSTQNKGKKAYYKTTHNRKLNQKIAKYNIREY